METIIQDIRAQAIAYIVGKYKIPAHQAEDIAQQAILEYLKAIEEKDIESPKAYIMATCRNMAVSAIRRAKTERKQQHRLESYYEKMMRSYGMQYEDPQEMIDEWRRVLPPKYAALLEELSRCPSIAELARKKQMNYNTLKSKVYTIRTYIESHRLVEEGYIISKNLLNRHQKEAVRKFVKVFAEYCKRKKIPSNSKYFKNIKISEVNLDFDIRSFQLAEITFLKKGRKKAYIAFRNSQRQVSFFYFYFYMQADNRICIIEPPKIPRVIKVVTKQQSKELDSAIRRKMDNRKRLYSKVEQAIIREICGPPTENIES